MVLVRPVEGCAGGKFAGTCAAFLSGRRRARETTRLARAAFAAAAAVPAAAATSAAATPLAALSAIGTLAALSHNLALLAAGFDAGARFSSGCRRRGTHRRLCGTRADVPIPLTPLLIPVVVLTPIAIAPVIAASL